MSHFTLLLSHEYMDNVPDKDGDLYRNMPEVDISTKIKPNKGTGLDQILGKVLKELALEIAPILTLIFTSLLQGHLPDQWKEQ